MLFFNQLNTLRRVQGSKTSSFRWGLYPLPLRPHCNHAWREELTAEGCVLRSHDLKGSKASRSPWRLRISLQVFVLRPGSSHTARAWGPGSRIKPEAEAEVQNRRRRPLLLQGKTSPRLRPRCKAAWKTPMAATQNTPMAAASERVRLELQPEPRWIFDADPDWRNSKTFTAEVDAQGPAPRKVAPGLLPRLKLKDTWPRLTGQGCGGYARGCGGRAILANIGCGGYARGCGL